MRTRYPYGIFPAVSLLLLTAVNAAALTINLTDPAAVYYATFPGPCSGPGGPFPSCGARGYLDYDNNANAGLSFTHFSDFNSADAGSLGDLSFRTAFSNFAVANGWTLDEQPALDHITYNITRFRTNAGASLGGISLINVDIATDADYAGPPLSQLVWTQALLINYSVTDGSAFFDPPKNVMDDYSFSQGSAGSGGAFTNACVAIPASPNGTTPSTIPASPANSAYCDPIYPFQYADKHFSDGPQGGYPKDSFRAELFLTTVNTTTNTLTLYDGGINYGFDLFTPEPATFFFGGAGLATLLAIARRRRSP